MNGLEAALRDQAARRGGKLKPRKPKRPRPPVREELIYYRSLRYFVEQVAYIVRRDIVPLLPQLLGEDPTPIPSTPVPPTVARRDATAEDIDAVFRRAAAEVAKTIPQAAVLGTATRTALRVSEWNANQLQEQIQQVAQVNLYDDNTGLAQHLEVFVSDNVSLIRSLTDKQLEDIKGIVGRGARAGTHHTEVAAQIEKQVGVTKRRAALIARDQVGKLNGDLTRIRQTNLGVRRYRWSTSLDERVRKGHAKLEDSVQEWAKPPIVDQKTGERGHPGQPIQCRCSAIPIIDDLLADAGLMDPDDVELGYEEREPPVGGTNKPKPRPPPTPKPPKPPPPPPPVGQPAPKPPTVPSVPVVPDDPAALAVIQRARALRQRAAAKRASAALSDYQVIAREAGPDGETVLEVVTIDPPLSKPRKRPPRPPPKPKPRPPKPRTTRKR